MIKGTGGSDFVVDLKIRNHTFHSGLTENFGGKDEGPDAHELLEGALAACTIQTVHMYAKRKGFELTEVQAEVNIESEGKETLIHRKVAVKGNLTEEQRARLFEISKRCPIHRLLESQVTIESELVSEV